MRFLANKKERAKRKRRINIDKKKAAALLAKKEELHPVAVAIAEEVAAGHVEEVVVYPAEPQAEDLAPEKKTWSQSIRDFFK